MFNLVIRYILYHNNMSLRRVSKKIIGRKESTGQKENRRKPEPEPSLGGNQAESLFHKDSEGTDETRVSEVTQLLPG